MSNCTEELYTLEGQSADGRVLVIVQHDDLDRAERDARNRLEMFQSVQVTGPDGYQRVFTREPFYGQSVWDIPVRDVTRRLERVLDLTLGNHGIDYVHHGWSNTDDSCFPPDQPIPQLNDGRYFIACYAVEGSSEGHYVHVELVVGAGRCKRICLIKTFGGDDEAWRIARIAHDFLAEKIDLTQS